MNKYIKQLLSLAAVAMVSWGCEADFYNEHMIDGYEPETEITDVQSVELTLTADDYSTISKNSTNKANAAAAGQEAVDALAAIGKNKYFANQDEAAAYIPAYLASAYPTFDNNSIAMVTYTTALDVPAEIVKMNAATSYTVSEDNYKTIWESEEEYVKAVTPATISKLKNVLPSEGLEAGDYVAVTYNYAAEEPQKEVEEEEPVVPEFAYTTVLGTAKKGDAVEINGYISAESAQGPILTDLGGSVLLYKTTDVAIGDQVKVKGTISSYNKGFQIQGATIEKVGTTEVKYPAPVELTGAMMDELLTTRTEDGYAIFAKMTGTPAISGNYYNFKVAGAEKAQGSIYGITDKVKEQVTDGKACTLYGYFCSISGGKYINMIVTKVEATSTAANEATAFKPLSSEKKYAYYKWNGSAFEETTIVAVQPSDYTEMGQKYGNFTNPAQDDYLPKFLGKTQPYALEGDVAYVAYRCYAGGSTTWKVDEYVNDGSVWNKTIYFTDKTDQFRKAEGTWAVDRTLELDYTGNGADTKAFYQYCVNWVYDNKDVPMGAPARDNAGVIISTDIVTINGEKPAGNYWVSNYGNNEFYTGASAYYGNIDWRASACKGGFTAAGMGDLSDDEIVAKLKEHTAEVFAAVLGYVYPEMTPEEYKKVVIKVYAYGPNTNYAYTFNVVEKGKFAYAEGSMTEI